MKFLPGVLGPGGFGGLEGLSGPLQSSPESDTSSYTMKTKVVESRVGSNKISSSDTASFTSSSKREHSNY